MPTKSEVPLWNWRVFHITCIVLALAGLLATMVIGQSAEAQTLTTLYSFHDTPDGNNPLAGVTPDPEGNLFGITYNGGSKNIGTIYKVDPEGNESVLHDFVAWSGHYPTQSLLRSAKGDLYGTTVEGGASGWGTVFKYGATGTFRVLHSFTGDAGGGYPRSSVVADPEGNLYGVTQLGGAFGHGTLYRVARDGSFTVVHDFTGGADGDFPNSLVTDGAGNFYGTTANGGAYGEQTYSGTVFKLDSSGGFVVLHDFGARADGTVPQGIILDGAGNIYGVTYAGGAGRCKDFYGVVFGCGTVFKVDAMGNESVLYSLQSLDVLSARMVLDRFGTLYGTATYSYGYVFKLDTAGNFERVHSFMGADGASPQGLVRDRKGNLYGITSQGGESGRGTVFKLSPR